MSQLHWRRWRIIGIASGVLCLSLCARSGVAGKPIEIKTVVIKVIEEVEVPAREEGQIQAIPVKPGDLVTEGQVLAQLDDSAIQLQYEQAGLEMEVAKIQAKDDARVKLAEEQLRVAMEDLDRNRASRERFNNSVSQSEVDQLEFKVATAKHELAQAKQELVISEIKSRLAGKTVEFADLKLQRHKIRSPLNGMVVELFCQAGGWMKPGDKLARVIRVDRLRAEGFIDQDEATMDLVGQAATVMIESPGRQEMSFPGKIVYVSPEVNTSNRQTRIWAEVVPEGRRLEPGLRGRMVISPAIR